MWVRFLLGAPKRGYLFREFAVHKCLLGTYVLRILGNSENTGGKKRADMAQCIRGHVVELVYTYASGAYASRLGGSSPLMPTGKKQ